MVSHRPTSLARMASRSFGRPGNRLHLGLYILKSLSLSARVKSASRFPRINLYLCLPLFPSHSLSLSCFHPFVASFIFRPATDTEDKEKWKRKKFREEVCTRRKVDSSRKNILWWKTVFQVVPGFGFYSVPSISLKLKLFSRGVSSKWGKRKSRGRGRG